MNQPIVDPLGEQGRTNASPQDPTTSAAIDWSVALEATGGDVPLLVDVLRAFCEETPRLVGELQQAIGAQDAALVRRAAHTIKNSMYTLGAVASGDLAYSIETAGRDSQLLDAGHMLPTLEEHVAQMVAQAQSYVDRHASETS